MRSPELATHHDWSAWTDAQDATLVPADTHRDDMAFWMYSSGSTGRPKGVVHLQHDALYTHVAYGRGVIGIGPDDVVFSPPKIFFAYGFGNSLTFPFAAGATTVLMPGRPDPEAVFATIERHRPTVLFGLPTLYVAMAAHPGSHARDLSSLRLAVSAAETLSAELFEEWKRRYGLAIVEGLGSTEVLHIYLSNAPALQKPGASGRRVPGYEVKLVDPDGNEIAGEGAGVLWVRGHSQAPRYWNRPDKTAETMRDGWIYTGDRFRRDADGFHFFEGRADDLVKVSGQWVHPVEVERCLADCPLVRECAVLAVEDANRLPRWRRSSRCAIRRRGRRDHRGTAGFVKSRLLPYKYPRLVRYFDELPKTGTGKIDRQALVRLGRGESVGRNRRSDPNSATRGSPGARQWRVHGSDPDSANCSAEQAARQRRLGHAASVARQPVRGAPGRDATHCASASSTKCSAAPSSAAYPSGTWPSASRRWNAGRRSASPS